MNTAYILDAVRTPRGRGKKDKGALSGIHPQELLAQAMNRLAEKSGLDKKAVEDVIVGCVSQAQEQAANVARNAVLAAGWPEEVSGVSPRRARTPSSCSYRGRPSGVSRAARRRPRGWACS